MRGPVPWLKPALFTGCLMPLASILLRAARGALGANRVELKCDARNARSRAAIAALGAKEEGTLRRHMVLGDGYGSENSLRQYFGLDNATAIDELIVRWPTSRLVQRFRNVAAGSLVEKSGNS